VSRVHLVELATRIPADRDRWVVMNLLARVRRILTSFPMPQRACPVCRVQGRLLEDTSKEALVEYYRCDKCGRIWTDRKADPNSPPTLVTVKAKTPDQSS
jgi:hypothetical protein